jgi:Ca2+-binding EF-hand superfamily protein
MPDEFKFDTNTVTFLIYLLYKSNIITRNHMKQMFKTIQEKAPEDIMKYLVEEVAKS